MFEVQLWAKDTQGSLQALQMSPEGGTLLTGIDVSDINISTLQASGAIDSTQVQLISRQTNPTAAADGAAVFGAADDLGRQLTWPFQVRDLYTTAAATLTNGSAATLLAAGGAGVFHDLVHITFANNSTVAGNTAQVQLLQDGTVMKTVQVPNANTLAIDFTYPLPQASAATVWTVDMEDISGSTVNVFATFIKNV